MAIESKKRHDKIKIMEKIATNGYKPVTEAYL